MGMTKQEPQSCLAGLRLEWLCIHTPIAAVLLYGGHNYDKNNMLTQVEGRWLLGHRKQAWP